MNDRVGQQFGSYRLLRLIGRGGFAEVYLGEHIHMQSQAAIKVVSTPLLQADQQIYLQEARVQVKLKHPHILQLLECGIEQNLPFLVMDYAPHGTLRQRHGPGVRVRSQQIIEYLPQIASALQYAHDQNLIHRDLKPENILIGQNGKILLSDFGIAINPSTSKPNMMYDTAGTPTYMAPEQIMGHPVYASDQYALAVIVYEWLAGKPPFQGSFHEITAQHLHASPPPFHQAGVRLRPEVEAIVMKALEKDPAKRFASVQEFALTLTSYSQSQITPQQKNHASTSSGVAPSQSILISPPSPSAQGTNYSGMINSHVPSPLQTPTQPASTQPASTQHPYIPSNPTSSRRTSTRRRFLLTVGVIGAVGGLSFWEITHLINPTPTNPVPTLLRSYTSGHTSTVNSVGWSPDGKWLASGDVEGKMNVWLVEQADNVPFAVYPYPSTNAITAIAWSPDSQFIAIGYNDFRIQIWSMTSQKQLLNYQEHQGPIHKLAWSFQQNLIASVSQSSPDIHIWEAATGKFLNYCTSPDKGLVSSLAWSHKSAPLYLAFSTNDPAVLIWDQNKEQFPWQPFGFNVTWLPSITAVAWNEDDAQLLLAAGGPWPNDFGNGVAAWVPGAESGRFTSRSSPTYPDLVEAICWKAGLVCAACSDGTLKIEDVNMDPTHTITYQAKTPGVTQNQNARAWSPDGKYLAYGMNDGHVVVWQIPKPALENHI